MDKKKVWTIIIGLIILGVILASTLKILDNYKINSVENKPEEVITAATQDTPETDDGNPNVLAFYRGNLYTQADEVETDGLVYKINKVSKSKDASGFLLDEDMLKRYTDENKNLTEEYWYYIVNLTITRKSISEFYQPEDSALYLNGIWLNFYDKSKKQFLAYELQSAGSVEDRERKDLYKISLDVGDSFTTDLVYIVGQKEIAEDDFILCINNRGDTEPYVSDAVRGIRCDKLPVEGE